MRSIPLFFLILFAFVLIGASLSHAPTKAEPECSTLTIDSLKIDAPAVVKQIIQAKCYDCHAEGGDEEAMKDLLWNELPTLHPEDQMYILDDIVESIEEKEMPPEDHLKDHPEDKLTRQEARTLIEWASALANKLDKG